MLERFEDEDGFVGYRSPVLAAVGVAHLFTTRIGNRLRELDLGDLNGRASERMRRAAGASQTRLVHVHQVHGGQVLVVGPGKLPDATAQADALVTERADVLIGVHVADCVPILLARVDGERVAAVHAGWRGLVAGVIPRALEVLGGDAVAALGPCIAEEAFEVGPEVADAFERAGLEPAVHPRANARAHVDLRAAAEHQLRAGGVHRIDWSDRCTYRDAREFYSYRRDVTHRGRGRTGRLGAWIAVARARDYADDRRRPARNV
jgi:YfiH family protein